MGWLPVAQKGKNTRGVASVHVDDPQHLRDPREALRRRLGAAFSVVSENPVSLWTFLRARPAKTCQRLLSRRGAVLRIVSP